MIRRRDRRTIAACAFAIFAACAPLLSHAACSPEGQSASSLATLKRSGFIVESASAREALAFGLIDCLASVDPDVRDGIAYEALQRWMRDGGFPPETLRRMRERLLAMLSEPDPDGVARPFAALVLAEVARTDRIAPWMREDERAAMVRNASTYLRAVSDYRGYETGVGWRHGIAHGADWAMQLAMNPALRREDLDALAQAVAEQAVPTSSHAYVFGEPERLVRPLLFVARRDAFSEADWRAWFAALMLRLGDDPAEAWKSEAWLARRHDASAFLHALYLQADRDDTPGVAKMKTGLLEALKALP